MHIGRLAGSFVVAALMSGPALAQTPPPATAPAPAPAADPAPKPVTLTAGMDVASAYMFRGIYQEDTGFIGQPWIDAAFTAYTGQGALSAITINGGNWDSSHSGPTGTWYESDYYVQGTFTFGKVKPGLLYTSYTSPADKFGTVHELAGVVSFDDSAARVPFSPKIVVAFEMSGQADGGLSKGTYLELGAKPALKLAPKLSLLIPLKMGLSLNDYYEHYDAATDTTLASDGFGYFDFGFIASVPLVSGKTSWELHGGVDFLSFGDNLKAKNNGDGFKPVASIGFGFTY
jgi:hypothetical protein